MKILFIFLLLFSQISKSDDYVSILDKDKINDILKKIPFKDKTVWYKNVYDHMAHINIESISASIQKLEKDEIDNSEGEFKKGDIDYTFYTTNPDFMAMSVCPLTSMFSFIKRGKQWIPQTKTANFLMKGICRVPD